MDLFSEFLFPATVVVAIFYAIYNILLRFDTERERQRVITSPRTVARATAGNLREAPGDDKLRQQAVTWPAVAVQIPATGNIVVTETPHGRDGGEPLVNLTADYTYHFQGKDYHSTSLAPHRVTVPRKQVYNIKGNYNSREVLYARVNPKQPEESYLSLGKSWFNWWVIVEGLFMVASCPAVCWLFSYLMYPKEGLGFRVVDVLVANPVAYFVSLCFIGIIFLQNDLIRSGSENIPLVKGP